MPQASFVLSRPIVRLFCFLALASLAAGCIYDHRVTQAIMERRRRAKAAEGAKLAPDRAAATRPVRFTGRVRFYVAGDFRRQHPSWREALRDLLDEANGVTRAAFGATLEDAGLTPWDPHCDAQSMRACLDELAARDPGDDETWVVGVLGAVPRFTTSLDDLGMAALLGRHAIVRDVWDEAERAAIDRAFDTHTGARRDEIYARRKRHKRLAVFLHEWGHTLGAVHAAERDDLLHPQYGDRMRDFGGVARGIIEASLIDRFGGDASHARLRAYLAMVRPGDITPGDREALERLTHQRASTPAPAAEVASPAAPTQGGEQAGGERSAKHPLEFSGERSALLADLTESDRERYQQVLIVHLDSDSIVR